MVSWLEKNMTYNKFLVKYVHDWLPLGNLVSKYASQYPPSCPSCKCEPEDYHHMLCCPNINELHIKLN